MEHASVTDLADPLYEPYCEPNQLDPALLRVRARQGAARVRHQVPDIIRAWRDIRAIERRRLWVG